MNGRNPNAAPPLLVGERLHELFSEREDRPAVAVVDGHGVSVRVDRGQLQIMDGIADLARHRSWAKATHGLARIVVVATTGDISIPTLRWCHGTGVGLVVIDPFSGAVLASSAHTSNDDPRLRRAQSLALATVTGLDLARFLTHRKLHGQSEVADVCLGAPSDAETIRELADEVESMNSVDEVRQIEAVAANVYFAAWKSVRVPFIRRDESRVPAGWKTFDGRRSSVHPGTARSATDPLNALLNYGYRLLEAEGRIACLAVGLDPGLGVMHADVKGRDSMVLDLIEPLRPVVDRFVLTMLDKRPLTKKDFDEDLRGVVRVRAPLTHELARAMPEWGRALGHLVEELADRLAASSPYDVSVPSVLTGAKQSKITRRRVGSGLAEASDKRRGRGPDTGGRPGRKLKQRPIVRATQVTTRCRICGDPIRSESASSVSRSSHCSTCIKVRRIEIGAMIQRTPSDRRGSAETATRRSHVNTQRRLEEMAWEKDHVGEVYDKEWFRREILPGLQGFSLTAIAKATGLSTAMASKIRTGKKVPHPRWWGALKDLSTVFRD